MAILVLAAVLFAVPIGWGGFPWTSQAPDEVRPKDVRIAEQSGFANGWATPYPPLLHYVLSATFFVGDRVGLEPGATTVGHLIAGRAVSCLAALATVLLIAGVGRRLGMRDGAWLAAFLWLSSPSVVYYAKTTNVESLYLLLLTLGIAFLIRFRQTLRGAWLLAAAVSAVLATLTKDQAGVYFLAAPALGLAWIARDARRAGHSAPAAWARALVDRRVLLTALAVPILAAVVLHLPANLEGVRKHYEIVARQPDLYVEHETSLGGRIDQAGIMAANLTFVAGLPAVLLAAAGLWILLRRRHALGEHVVHLSCAVVYLLFFWWMVPRNYARFALPAALSIVWLAGVGWESAIAPRLRTGARRVVLALVLLVSLARAVELDLRMLWDSRSLVGPAIEARGGGPDSTWVLNREVWSPVVGAPLRMGTTGRFRRILREHRPAHLVAESALLESPNWRWIEEDSDYRVVWRSDGPIPACLSKPRFARSNLDKISPELVVLERRSAPATRGDGSGR